MIDNLKDARILLVEDEMLVCMDIEYMLKDFGCEVVGPAVWRLDPSRPAGLHQPAPVGRRVNLAEDHGEIGEAVRPFRVACC